MQIESKVYGSIPKFKTHCCALAQLSIANDHSLKEIKYAIHEMKKEAKTEMNSSQQGNYGTHERAVFVITLEKEEKLVENLQKLGFQEIAKFHRRICYPQDELLTMWILSW